MGMPEIPEAKHRPNLKNTVIDLLESIALEEIALSHIVNSEAEKIQAFIGKKGNFPFCSSGSDIIKFNKTTNQMMDTIAMKEWLLLKKLDRVLQIDFCDESCKDDEKNDNFDDIIDDFESE